MAELDGRTRRRLLQAARSAIEAELFGLPVKPNAEPWPPMERRGVFVTLRKSGDLRGCIGTFVGEDELPATIRSIAVGAANDPRFLDMPISRQEMKDIRIEISVLSPLQRARDPLDLEIGVHGVYIKRGVRSGCFLPSVATDNAWDKETFLTECCQQKAGLDPLAWRDPDTEVFTFTVERFGDGDS
ncbi:MAG: AmmeMemoRadiSam system protein A [Phycisphaerae bacterium]|nr:AmmeMemoRadiSam system protein A [Phycisphaerae bacterium]